jgi:hypothetical protein
MTKKLNYNLSGGLRIDKETFDLINKISNDLMVRNTDIVRILLRAKCEEIEAEGIENFSLVIAGRKKKMKGEKEND